MDNLSDNIENLDATLDAGMVTITPSPIVISEDDYKAALQARLGSLLEISGSLDAQKASVGQAIADVTERIDALAA